MVLSYLGTSGATVFTTLVLMTGITAAIPYAFSALAQIIWRVQDQRTLRTPRFVRDVAVAVVALVFSIAVHLLLPQHRQDTGTWSGDRSSWPAAHSLLGIPVYLRQREPDDRAADRCPSYK